MSRRWAPIQGYGQKRRYWKLTGSLGCAGIPPKCSSPLSPDHGALGKCGDGPQAVDVLAAGSPRDSRALATINRRKRRFVLKLKSQRRRGRRPGPGSSRARSGGRSPSIPSDESSARRLGSTTWRGARPAASPGELSPLTQPSGAASLSGCRPTHRAAPQGTCRSISRPRGELWFPRHPATCQSRHHRVSAGIFFLLGLKPSERGGSEFPQVRVGPRIRPIDHRAWSESGEPLG